MSRIFVSYRRTDAPGHAGRLYDRLVDRFGPTSVFKDVDTMEPGADFTEVIETTVARCDAVVAVIGQDWLASGADGKPRIADERDWVRIELRSALERNIRVIPALVEGAQMPTESELPADVEGLARRHGIELSETAWSAQVEQLIDSLDRALASAAAAGEPEASLPAHGWRTKLVRSTVHTRLVQFDRADVSFVLGYEVTMLSGMSKLTVDGRQVWKGAANSSRLPALTVGGTHRVRLERRRVLGVNALRAIRVFIDDTVVYDEGY
jgi:TIR domain